MASLCSFPTTPLITSRKPHILFPNHPSLFPLPLPKSNSNKFPTLFESTASQRARSRCVSTISTTVVEESSDLAKRWRDIMGKNDWNGLLDPIDRLLRQEILKYGDLCAATYEAFICDVYDRDYGVCKFEVPDFFDHKMMPQHGYQVTQFIYCTSTKDRWLPFIPHPINPRTWNENNIWMGYIAVSDDTMSKYLGRRDICIAWRGTITPREWKNDFMPSLVNLPLDMPSPKRGIRVENGFLTLYTQTLSYDDACARKIVLEEVKRLVNEVYPNEELSITVTGHSLGASLAVLNAYDIVESGVNGKAPVSAITFAGPRVGNPDFRDRVKELGVKVLRVVNHEDVAPMVPDVFVAAHGDGPEWLLKFSNKIGVGLPYCHVGVELLLDMKNSPYLNEPSAASFIKDGPVDPVANAHNLEVYLHLVDGYHGCKTKFELATGRDLALLNKSSDVLKDEYLVPPNWRVELDKSMVKYKGRWVHESTINMNPPS